jgi:hypothetical protein
MIQNMANAAREARHPPFALFLQGNFCILPAEISTQKIGNCI